MPNKMKHIWPMPDTPRRVRVLLRLDIFGGAGLWGDNLRFFGKAGWALSSIEVGCLSFFLLYLIRNSLSLFFLYPRILLSYYAYKT